MDSKSISHTKWKCQYHIVFIPKYRKKQLYENADTLVKKITVSSDRRINAYELRDFLGDI